MTSQLINRLVSFVQSEFGVSHDEVMTALRHDDHAAQLPMILWQYGFISLKQLDLLFDWLERARIRSVDG